MRVRAMYALLLVGVVIAYLIPINAVASDNVRYEFTVVIPVKLAGETKQKVGTATITKTNNIIHFNNIQGGKYEIQLVPQGNPTRYVIVTYDQAPPQKWWTRPNLPNTLLNAIITGSVTRNITVPSGTHTLYVGVSTGAETWTVTLYKWVQSSNNNNGAWNGQVTVNVVNDVVKVTVDVPNNIYVVRGGTANITLKVKQIQGYTRYFSAQVSLPSHDLQASVNAAHPVGGHANEWRGNDNVTVSLTVPLSASEGTQYVLNISIFASHDPADTYSTPPTPPPAVVYSGSNSNVGDEWKLCGKIGFSPLNGNGKETPSLILHTTGVRAAWRNVAVVVAAVTGVIVLAVVVAVASRRR